jgi:fatty-acyl-CoA synthase
MIRKVYEEARVKSIVNTYGLSESAGNVGTTRLNDPLDVRMHWNGSPLQDTEVKIVDVETGQDLSVGKEGEICFRGFNVMRGYYKDPDGTTKVTDRDGWMHTGDTGMMNERGYFKYTGRLKDMIKVGGENVSALEIEDFILRHPAVKEVQVVGVPDARLVEVLLASIILREGVTCSESDIIDFCKGKIARFKIPRYIRFVKEYPMTASGKVQKVKLRDMWIQDLGLSQDKAPR